MHPCTPWHPSQPTFLHLQGLLQRLGPIAAAAAIFLGGYGTGLASSNMYADIQAAEKTLVSQTLPAAQTPVRQASLTMPDKVTCAVHTPWRLPYRAPVLKMHLSCIIKSWQRGSMLDRIIMVVPVFVADRWCPSW
jgi:hypothetical protein